MSAKTQRLKKIYKKLFHFWGVQRGICWFFKGVNVKFRIKNSNLRFRTQKIYKLQNSSHLHPAATYQISSRNHKKKKSYGNLKSKNCWKVDEMLKKRW